MKTCVFYCSNHLEADAFAALTPAAGHTLRTVGLPCSGKVDVPYLMKAFETGADGVVIVTCGKNECRHFEGNLRARKRAEATESLLAEIGLATGRMAVLECEEKGSAKIIAEIQQFIERVRNLPSPELRAARSATPDTTFS